MEKVDLYQYEHDLWNNGINYIGGVDEVGRGPLIGPVVTACVVLPKDFYLEGLTDSKKLTEKKRDIFYDYIMEHALAVSVGMMDEKVIDEVNIYEATKLAMYQAINNCPIKPEHVLIDAMKLENLDIPSTSIIKGDLDKKYPMYGFKSHKGYPTKKHVEAILKYGLIDGYRKTFKPISEIIKTDKSLVKVKQ